MHVKKTVLSMALAALTTVFTIMAGAPAALASTASAHATTPASHSRAAIETGVKVVTKTGVLPASSADAPTSVLKAARAASLNSTAATYCQTIYAKDTLKDAIGITLATFQMNTYYCWNYSIVTYHSTWENNSSNGTLGWSYKGLLSNYFTCYYANSNWYSGNYEQMQANFGVPSGRRGSQPAGWRKSTTAASLAAVAADRSLAWPGAREPRTYA